MSESALRVTEQEDRLEQLEPEAIVAQPAQRFIPGLDVRNKQVGELLDYRNVVFTGEVRIENVTFNAGCLFSGAKFQSRVIFRNVSVRGSRGNVTAFQNCTFGGTARFDRSALYLADFSNSIFEYQAYFNQAKFNATARFDNVKFLQPAHFKSCSFAGAGSFQNTKFRSTAIFKNTIFRYWLSHARFNSTVFDQSADFEGVRFCGHADFSDTKFNGGCLFLAAKFCEHDDDDETSNGDRSSRRGGNRADLRITFENATFISDHEGHIATFQGAKFGDRSFPRDANFDNAQFHIGTSHRTGHDAVFADFTDCDWFGAASFRNVSFRTGVDAKFDRSRLEEGLDLTEVEFDGDATFERIHARDGIILSDAKFSQVPDFQQATLSYPPKLDVARLPEQKIDVLRRLRAIRKLAAQSEDRKTEHAMLVQEFKHDGGVTSALYGLISNYGQSWWRPAAWLVLLTITLFPLLYLSAYRRVPASMSAVATAATSLYLPCSERSGNSLAAALELSVRNASIVAAGNEARREHITECLAGTNLTGFASVAAAFLEATQIVLTAVFVFFIGSSVRRRLQMR